MAIPKVMGTETEYGIAASGQPDFNPVLSSSMLISAYAGSLRKIRWDYEDESPMRDARGFEPQPGREMSDEDLGLANVILPNGARYYVDHAHPEYSTPECLTPRDLVIHDKAGERILERSLDVLAADMPRRRPCRSTRTTPTARAIRTAPMRTTWSTARPRSQTSSAT